MQLRKTLYSFLLALWALPLLAHAEEMVIPVLVAQTGDAALFGQSETEGYLLAAEEWNARGGVHGNKVTLKLEDTQTDQRQMMTAYQRLSLSGIPALLGPTWLDTFQAILPVARKRGTLLVTPSSAREAFSDSDYTGIASFYNNTRTEIGVLVKELQSRGLKRIALVYEQEPFAELLRKLVLEIEPNLTFESGVRMGDSDFLSTVSKLRTAKADVVLVFLWQQRALLSFLTQLRVQSPKLPIATCHDGEGWLKNDSIRPAVTPILFSSIELSDPTFAPRFEKRFGHPPILVSSNAYDAMNTLLSARAAGKNTATEIRSWIFSEEHTSATFGRFRFGADGSVPSRIKVIAYTH